MVISILSLLEIVQLANTGVMAWKAAGPLLQQALERGENAVTLDQVKAAQAGASQGIDQLTAAIAAKRAARLQPPEA